VSSFMSADDDFKVAKFQRHLLADLDGRHTLSTLRTYGPTDSTS